MTGVVKLAGTVGTDTPAPLVLVASLDRRELYEAHASAVAGRLMRLCADAEVARDLTQDAFLVAFARLEGDRGPRDPVSAGPWLHGIAYNLLRDHRRTARRRRGIWARLGVRRAVSVGGAPAEGEPALVRRLRAALAGLDDDKHDAFVLRIIEGLSVEDTATVQGVSPATVSYRTQRAEAHIRKHFEAEEDPS